MKTEAAIRQALRDWVVKNSRKGQPHPRPDFELEDDTPIIEQRIITSLQVMDLILYIESLTERSIDVDSLKPGSFRDLNTIYNNFFNRGP